MDKEPYSMIYKKGKFKGDRANVITVYMGRPLFKYDL